MKRWEVAGAVAAVAAIGAGTTAGAEPKNTDTYICPPTTFGTEYQVTRTGLVPRNVWINGQRWKTVWQEGYVGPSGNFDDGFFTKTWGEVTDYGEAISLPGAQLCLALASDDFAVIVPA